MARGNNNNTVENNIGNKDIWLIKTDGQGNEEWKQTFGGSDAEYGYSVKQT